MGFPFVAPLKETIVAKLKKREEEQYKKNITTTYSPFAILSSGALVTKAKNTQDIFNLIKNAAWPKENNAYYGCVVNNTTDVKNQYQNGATLVGYDLNGKPIYVEGETNRRVSTPIITDIEIDTDGNNNTLKTAKVNIKVFTLKQLEMFEMFFLRPAMDVVLEFGYNSDIRGQYYNQIAQHLFVGQGYTHWQNKFLKQFSHKDNAYKEAKVNYLETLKLTNYDYDFFAGKVLNFNFSPDTDGTYNVQIEISSGNELQMWVPLKQSSPVGKLAKASQESTERYKQWMNVIAADVNLPKLINDTKFQSADYIKSELFNWGIINTDEKDTNVSKDPYISFRFILDIMNSSKIVQTQKNNTIDAFYYEDAELKKPIIPVSSHTNIMSTNPSFILPGILPAIYIAKLEGKQDQIILDENPKKANDCHINGKSFNIKGNSIWHSETEPDKVETPQKLKTVVTEIQMGDITIGNLYNVFIKYEIFTQIFNESYVQADCINALLAEINLNMFGLCKLELGKVNDVPNQEPLTIIDTKLKNITANFEQNIQKIYRFKVGPIGSIVREFEFNMEMDELMQGQTMFAAEYDKLKILETGDTDNIRTANTNESDSYADLSFLPNGDGYCSINKVGIELNKEYLQWYKKQEEATDIKKKKPKPEETEDEIQKLNEVLKGNYIRFKLNTNIKQNTETALNHLIYTDPALIQNYIPKKENGTTVLTFLDITLKIDGMSGLSCGEYFNVDGIPEIYNQNGYFQITNVKHELSDNDWKTTIEASYLLKSGDNVEDTNTADSNKGNQYKERPISSKSTIVSAPQFDPNYNVLTNKSMNPNRFKPKKGDPIKNIQGFQY